MVASRLGIALDVAQGHFHAPARPPPPEEGLIEYPTAKIPMETAGLVLWLLLGAMLSISGADLALGAAASL